jgi:hypothetical protein
VGSFLQLNKDNIARLGILRGRARFSAMLVATVLASENGDVGDALLRLVEGMTVASASLPMAFPEKSSLVPLIKAIANDKKDITIKARAMDLILGRKAKGDIAEGDKTIRVRLHDVFCGMVVNSLLTGAPSAVHDASVLALIERGLCCLERQGDSHVLLAVLAEPLVVKAAANGLDLSATVTKTMSLVRAFPSATGSLWESFLAGSCGEAEV